MKVGAYYNEIDPYAAEWLRNLIAAGLLPAGDVDERSIVDVRGDDLAGYSQCHFFAGIGGWPYALRLAGIPDDAEAWTGSCPCQPFSVAGRGAGTADERHLWPAFHRLIAERRPPVVFGEQVASADGVLWLAGVRADLEECGYAVGAADLPAAGIGAPHIRQRLYWVADAHDDGLHRAGGVAAEPGSDGQDGRLHRRGTGWEADAGHERAGRAAGPGEAQGGRALSDVAGCGAGGRLADATGGGFGADGRAPGERGHADQCGQACGLGDADGTGREERCGAVAVGPELLAAECAGGLDRWRDAVLIPCGDGKSRRIEPGISPLAHGVPFRLADGRTVEGASRTGILKGLGNAIVPPLAAEFVLAFLGTQR